MGLDDLCRFESWTLQRISPRTFPQDVGTTLSRRGGYSKREIEAIVDYVRQGTTFRCRIKKGRFHFGRTAAEAIEAAVNSAKKKRA